MSFSGNTTKAVSGNLRIEETKRNPEISAFERLVANCCKAPEWELRKWLKKVLTRAGFVITEDAYRSERTNKEERYGSVHNMLAVRGKPNVCLVAHTDVCRDHSALRDDFYYPGNHPWMEDREETAQDKVKVMRKVDPVIKVIETDGQVRRIIQDRDCKLQVGGDDRLGVAINVWVALNSGYDIGLFFPTDEEIGLKSSRACEMQQLKEFDLLVQTDRGNHSDQIVLKIASELICPYDHAVKLLSIAYDMGKPRVPTAGMSTDVLALHSKGLAQAAINLTIGYHNSIGADASEYIDVEEAWDSARYVAEIVKNYWLGQ